MSRLLEHLNEAQRSAVTLPAEHALILAGAGSGKTRVLITRVAWLIATAQVNPRQLLAVTFTNKAAREMNTRLGALLALETRSMWIGTFHGLCNRLLRAHYRDANLPQSFQILDSADQLAAIKRMLRGLGVDAEKFPPRNLQHFINSAKDEGLRAGQVEAGDDYSRQLAEFYARYDEQCQREGVVDFAELLLRVHDLLVRNELLREHYQLRFRHILVDEFQDTNRLQYQLLKLFAGARNTLFAVGDDDQSIYAFRGANVGNMSAFEREFSVRNLIRLEQNYRSHGNILRCANALIENNRKRLGKTLWTEAGHGEPVRVYEAPSDGIEARWLIEQVQALIDEGYARSDIAILYRSNAQSRVLEHALFTAGLPYRVYGGLRFFERAEVKHALAYLRLLENPDDDGAFLRVVNFPPRGIGARTLEALQDVARERATSLHGAVGMTTGAGGAKLASFAALLAQLREEAQDRELPQVVESVLARSTLIAHYTAEREGQDRLENLRELVNAAAGFAADPMRSVAAESDVAPWDELPEPDADTASAEGRPVPPVAIAPSPLAAFLAHASLEAGENQALEGVSALQLMTVHSAKGLEFDAVFVTGLEEGLFPHENSLAESDGLEEERRLMYVAITRARKNLYLSFSQTRMLHGQTRYSLKSRFIDELPPDALKWLGAVGGAAGATPWRTGAGGAREGFAGHGSRYPGAAPAPAPLRADPAAKNFDRGISWRIGQSVTHAKFGDGVIVGIEGRGEDARVNVNFARVGPKWLALALAHLQPGS